MTTTNRFYRVRVWSGEGTLADFLDPTVASNNLLVATSVRGGTNPYIPDHGEPKGDGQTLDPLTGVCDVGAYTVRVLDVPVSEASAPAAEETFDRDGNAIRADWSGDWGVTQVRLNSNSGLAGSKCLDVFCNAVGYHDGYTVTRTFTGLAPNTEYTVSVWARPVYDFFLEGLLDGVKGYIDYGMTGAVRRVTTDGSEADLVDGGWQRLAATRVSDASGSLPITVGVFGQYKTAGSHVLFDNVTITEGVETGEGRIVTQHLADADAHWQLLSRQAVVEVSEDAVTWSTQTTGYLNGLRLVDALEWEFTIGDTRRTELQAELFRAMPAPSDDGSVLTTPPLLIGGPLWNGAAYATPTPGGFGGVTDFGPTRVAVIEQVGHSARQLDLNLVGGYWPPYYVTAFKDDEIYAINAYARQFFEYDDTTWAYDSGQESSVYGWFPGLVVQLTRVSDGAVFLTHPLAVATRRRETDNNWWTTGTGPWGTVDNLVEQNVILRVDWDEATMGAPKPAAGEQFDVRIWPARPSERFPVHERGHPIALHTAKLDQHGIPYDAASAASVTSAIDAAYGGAVTAELVWDKALPLAEYAETLQAFFGYGVRLNASGTLEFFGLRYSNPSDPTAVTVARRRDHDTVIWEEDEESIVTSVEVEARTFTTRLATQSFESGPGADEIPLSTLVLAQDAVIGAADPDATTQTRTVRYSLPGRVLVNGIPQRPATTRTGPVRALAGYAVNAGNWVVDWRREGVPKTTLHCLPDVTAQVGDLVTVEQPDLPVAVAGTTPVTQRGQAGVLALVLQRTETPGGPDLVVVQAPPAAQATLAPGTGETPTGTPLDDRFTLARSSADPARVVTITLTDAATLATADVRVRVEYRLAASEPATGDAYGGRWAVGDFPLSLPAAVPGSTVWVRIQLVTPTGGFLKGWTGWQSLTLGTSPVVVPAPSLSYDALVLAATGVPDVTAILTPPAVSVKLAVGAVDGGPPDAATVRAAPADTTEPYEATFAALAEGQHVIVGAFAYDADGNESAMATLTVARPAAPSVSGTTSAVAISFDGGGAALEPGAQAPFAIPFAGTVTGWTLLADQAGDLAVDLWRDTYAAYPPTAADSLWGGSVPALAGAAKAQATGLNIPIAAGDTFIPHIASAATITRATLTLTITRS